MTELIERDWARVQEVRCDECGFRPREVRERELPAALRAMGERWVIFVDACLSRPDGAATLSAHSRSGTWSPLELACHVRDAIDLTLARVEVTLRDEQPRFAYWDYESAVAQLDYADQNPRDVGADIAVNAGRLADVLSHVDRALWDRSATMRGRRFTASGLVRFALHEGHHHLMEAERGTQVLGVR